VCRLAVLGGGERVRLLEGGTGAERGSLEEAVPVHGAVALSPDGTRLAVLDERFGLTEGQPRGRLLALDGTGTLRALALPPHRHGGASFSADGRELRVVAVLGRDGPKVVRFDGRSGDLRGMTTVPLEFVVPQLSGDGELVVHRSGPGEAAVAEVHQGRPLAQVEVAAYDPLVAAFAPDGRRVLVGSQGQGAATALDLRTGEARELLPPGEQSLRAVVASRDGAWFAAAGVKGTLDVWEVGTLRRRLRTRIPDLVELGSLADGTLVVRTLRPRIERPSENFVRAFRLP